MNPPAHDDGLGDELYDARLRRVLEHAPDAQLRPSARTRERILQAAHGSAVPAAPATQPPPWWRQLWAGAAPRARMPWNAALASVLVAVFVTALWQREPVPDARLEGDAPVASAPLHVPPSAPAAPAEPATPMAAPPARTPMTAAVPSAPEATAPQRRPPPTAAPAPAEQARARAPAVAAAPSAPMPAPAPGAPTPAPAPASAASEAATDLPRAHAQPMERMTAQSQAASPLQRAQPKAGAGPTDTHAGGAPPFDALVRWSRLTVQRDTLSAQIPRGQAGGLPALIDSAARAATLPAPAPAEAADLRLVLEHEGTPLAVLELAGDALRYTPAGGAPLGGRPDAATMQALRGLLEQHLAPQPR